MAIEKRILKVIANCNLKYDKDVFEVGEKFKIRKSDKEDMESRGFITVEQKESNESEEDEVDPEEVEDGEAK